ncbi:MAG: HDOD domain-containing protein [Gemmatimonadetes bacterium]|nr:HDOD domain-containing protein [Gemmatimonadota bacterium]
MNPPPPRGLDLDRLRASTGKGVTPGTGGGAALAAVPGVVAKERRVQSILANIENLPSLPSVVMQTLRLANDESAGANDFEEIIRQDQVLAARVLKLVNSPFFALRRTVQSIPQAIVVLGLKSLKSVVLAAKTSRLLGGQLGPYGFVEGGLWQHSMSCATVARSLAKSAGLSADAQEEMFVAGLLHDVGKLVLAPHAKEIQKQAASLAGTAELVSLEHDTIGMSHCEAGGRMARKWGLPDRLIDLIENHHVDPEAASVEVRIVQLANLHCNRAGIGLTTPPDVDASAEESLLHSLGLADRAEAICAEIERRLDELRPLLEDMAKDSA